MAKTYNVHIHIVRMPVNKSAPFRFAISDSRLFLYDVADFDANQLQELYNKLKPEIVFCSGWINKMYLKLCIQANKESVTILGFDTQWNGSFRQIIGTIYARFFILPYFHFAFVPGNSQAKLAAKIGFDDKQIVKGFYASDINMFNEVYKSNKERSKVFVFTGRYSKEKGIQDLCEVFISLRKQGFLPEWQLWCIGVGDYKIPEHSEIKDLGFQQPEQLKAIMENAGVFVLPSTFEPWGVVVQEFAAAGFPLICSDAVGSTEVFLEDGKNGFLFEAGNKLDLANKIKKMCNLNAESLMQMSKVSFELAQKITPETWAKSLYNLIK